MSYTLLLSTSFLHPSLRCIKPKRQHGLHTVNSLVLYTDSSKIKLVIMYHVDFVVILGGCIINSNKHNHKIAKAIKH